MARPVSPLLSTVGLIAGFGALIGAAWAGYSALVMLLGLALSAALVTKAWSHLCLKGVTCERRLSERRVFPDDEVLLTLRVVNRKVLPLPWVEVRDEMPASLVAPSTVNGSVVEPTIGSADRLGTPPARTGTSPAPENGADPPVEATEQPGFVTLSRSTPLLWYSAATFTHRLDSSARGYYPLGPLSVASGDIFGLHPRVSVHSDIDHLIVYPRTYQLSELGIPTLSHLGDAITEQRMFDDPSRLMGTRDYAPGDSPRRIHWKASARSRALQVKLFESTTDLKVAVFLAIDTFAGLPLTDLELGISTAASLARHLLERGVQTGLFVNTWLADTQRPARVVAGSGTDQLALILEALAKTTPGSDCSFVDFFDRARGELGFGGTLILVAGEVSTEIGLLMAGLSRAGKRVLGFCLEAQTGESDAPGVRWHRVSRPETSIPHSAAGTMAEAPLDKAAVA